MTVSRAVEILRVLPAPIEETFRWFTEPELLERWMSPAGAVEAEVDFRIGGAFRIVMRDAEVAIEHRGEYLEIDPPRRLVFTWRSRYTAGASLVKVSLEPESDALTRVEIVHSQLPADVADAHAGGWGAMADRLGQELQAA